MTVKKKVQPTASASTGKGGEEPRVLVNADVSKLLDDARTKTLAQRHSEFLRSLSVLQRYDTSVRTLPDFIPGCSRDAAGNFIPEEFRVPQPFQPGVKIAICEFVAEALLKLYAINRPLDIKTVEQYARDMVNGKWVPNDASNTLICSWTALLDFQHRLHAKIKADSGHDDPARPKVPLLVTVAMGVDPAAFSVFDTGKVRTTKDTLYIANKKGDIALDTVSPIILAAATRLFLLVTNSWAQLTKDDPLYFVDSDKIGNGRILELIKENPGLISSVAAATVFKEANKLLLSGVTSIFHFLMAGRYCSSADALKFLEMINSGAGLSAGDPVLCLREKLQDQLRIRRGRGTRTTMRAVEQLGYLIKAWNALQAGRKVTQFNQFSKGANRKIGGFTESGRLPRPTSTLPVSGLGK